MTCEVMTPNVRVKPPAEAGGVSAWAEMMHQVPQPRLTLPAVAGRLERGVRQHSAAVRMHLGCAAP